MNNHKSKVWTISAAIIFGLVALATAGLLVKVAGLNMLPMKYMGLVISVVVFLLLLIFAFFAVHFMFLSFFRFLFLFYTERSEKKVGNC